MSALGPRPIPMASRVIDKQPLHVEVITKEWVVEGDIHVMINHRPSDVLNDENGFLPMTDATLRPRSGGEAVKHPFVALNKRAILYLRECAPPAKAQ